MSDLPAWFKNSTNVRNMVPAPITLAWRLLQLPFPALAARIAVRWFFTAERGPLSPDARAFLATGVPSTVLVRGETTRVWTFGEGDRTALLMHGWSGRASQMRHLARGLLDAGWRVVALDAPGHGESTGTWSSLAHYAEAIEAVSRRTPPELVVAHSFGAAGTILAIGQGRIDPDRVVLVGPNGNPLGWVGGWLRALGARPATLRRFVDQVVARVGLRFEDIDPWPLVDRLRARALVVHDRGDREVPYDEGALLAERWPGARLVPTTGLGHRRVLQDRDVVTTIVRFAAGDEAAGTCEGCGASAASRRCDTCTLGHDLFHRRAG